MEYGPASDETEALIRPPEIIRPLVWLAVGATLGYLSSCR